MAGGRRGTRALHGIPIPCYFSGCLANILLIELRSVA
jgi:hypothetical protein